LAQPLPPHREHPALLPPLWKVAVVTCGIPPPVFASQISPSSQVARRLWAQTQVIEQSPFQSRFCI
jgi:hypothetical protein